MSTTVINTPVTETVAINAALALADGTIFYGQGIGCQGIVTGEICFNTAMTGYQEILTDPSYAGQIITFTFPHIGNVGINDDDNESSCAHAKGLILRDAITPSSNFRSQKEFPAWLEEEKLTGICGVDTRALTRHIRETGAQCVAISHAKSLEDIDINSLIEAAKATPSLKGQDLASKVTCQAKYEYTEGEWSLDSNSYSNSTPEQQAAGPHIVAIDYGVKYNILRNLVMRGCRVTVIPATSSAEEIISLDPDGIFLSNGPADPAATGKYAIPVISQLIDSNDIPVFGICLGHQMLASSQGCVTEKMHQGHRGANHPVQDLESRKVDITSQNHGFVVSKEGLPDNIEITHLSLFDNTIQGIRLTDREAFSLQGHPEASPGPHDIAYIFDRFTAAAAAYRSARKAEKKHA